MKNTKMSGLLRGSQGQRVVNTMAILGTILAISILFPGGADFGYEYRLGQTWPYEDLVAAFDFPIYKRGEELRTDKRDAATEQPPVYQLDTLRGPRQVDAVRSRFGTGRPQGVSDDHLAYGCEVLVSLYRQGILGPEAGRPDIIMLVQGNRLRTRTVGTFLDLAQARRHLADSLQSYDPAGFPPVLRQALEAALAPNISYDSAWTEKLRSAATASVTTTKGMVREGTLIVREKGVVTQETFDMLSSYERAIRELGAERPAAQVFLGYVMLLTLLLGTFMMYLGAYRREILEHSRYLLFVLLWLLVFGYLSKLLRQEVGLSSYLIPYCIAPIVIRHFFTYRLAFFTHVVVILVVSMINSEGFPFLFTQLVAGVVAVLTVADARNWSVFFRSMLYIFLAYAVSLLGLSLTEGNDLSDIDWSAFGWLVGNGLLTLVAFPLIPLMERVFGFTSSISLVELAAMNRPLLRELAMKAPGTFQHSLQVGNLAEAAAIEIGANPLLVRTGALYHDIGKLNHPEYFMENQPFRSPHEDLTPTESAAIIMAHVADGLQLARKHNLPKVITRFIATHHGTSQVSYFYRHWLRAHPDETTVPAEFSYPGPRPQTKCETLVMLADTLEATARSLKEPSGTSIDALVDKVIREKMETGQLAESRITVEDLEKCRRVFRQMLRSIHHVRAEYPET